MELKFSPTNHSLITVIAILAMIKVKECKTCVQGFDEDNNLIGASVPSAKCKNGLHDGPIERIPLQMKGILFTVVIYAIIFLIISCCKLSYIGISCCDFVLMRFSFCFF